MNETAPLGTDPLGTAPLNTAPQGASSRGAPSMGAAPVSADEFDLCMAALGPWPARPSLAVAVSGGRDSLALAYLLKDWIAARQGRLLGLVVDHRLRPESRAEAEDVATRLSALGVDSRILTWQEGGGRCAGLPIQADARAARYALLAEACRSSGLVDICLGHQADDQIETLMLRLAADSDLPGLAGISLAVARDDLRLLRPLLGVSRARLAATLLAAGIDWIDDPSNEDSRHRRVALRQARPLMAASGLGERRLAAVADAFGRLRVQTEGAAADLLAHAVSVHPAGFVRFQRTAFAEASPPVARQALGELTRWMAGRDYPPSADTLERTLLCVADPSARSRTLAGLRLLLRREAAFLFPEPGRAETLTLPPGRTLLWQGHYEVFLPAQREAEGQLTLRPLGAAGWQAVAEARDDAAALREADPTGAWPGPLLAALPALYDLRGPRELPALGWRRAGSAPTGLRLRFRSKRILGSFGFTVAYRERHII